VQRTHDHVLNDRGVDLINSYSLPAQQRLDVFVSRKFRCFRPLAGFSPFEAVLATQTRLVQSMDGHPCATRLEVPVVKTDDDHGLIVCALS
jgi:hypothetical protein